MATVSYRISEDILDLFEYDPFSPTFLTNATTRGSRAVEGAPAGSYTRRGGYFVKVGKTTYQNARIIWEKHHGPIADGLCIGFKDGNNSNADIRNLELRTNAQRMYGCSFETNKTGYRGVSVRYHADGTPFYTSTIKHKGKQLFLGCFDTPYEAWLAYKAANKGLERTCGILN